MNYQGDILLGDTIDIKFTSVNSTGVPTALAGSPAASAYVDNGTSEITAGVTLSVDFDARTGLNNVRVVASSGNGFATGTNVQIVLTAGTVGGNSVVGYVVGSFSIEKRSPARPGAAMTLTSAYDAAKTAASPAQVNTEADAALADVGLTPTITGRIDASVSSRATQASLDAVAAVINAIKAIDDKLNTTVELDGSVYRFTTNALEQGVGADPTAIAEAVLKRDWTLISGEPAFCLLQAARLLRDKWNTTDIANTLAVYKEDGATLAWTRPLTTDPAAAPITGAS